MKKFLLIFFIPILVLIFAYVLIKEKISVNSELNSDQNKIESEIKNGKISFNDTYAESIREVDFINGEADILYGNNNNKKASYKTTNIIQPIDLNSDNISEYPFLISAKYSDDKYISYLLITTKDGRKFSAVDQIIIGDANRVERLYSTETSELAVKCFIGNENSKEAVYLVYSLEDNKIKPGKFNIDINSEPAVKETLTLENISSENSPAEKGKIAIIFNDGPGVYTENILEILNEYNIKATFFVTGKNAEKYPGILAKIKNEGHEIANHTMDNPYIFGMTENSLKDSISDTNSTIKNTVSDASIKWFGSPFNESSEMINSALTKVNLEQITADIDSRDWSGIKAPDLISFFQKEPKVGSIISFNDGVANASETAKALPEIIKSFIKSGLKPVTISELKNK